MVATVMGGYEGHRGWINYLAVSPDHQRKGYGQAIMKEVELSITAKGCPKINLQVRNTNQTVIEFYKAIGYGNDDVVGLGKRFEHDS
ncbi:GNAT family N-acetyltransferase [Marinomonas foliarum]|uniref:GNAT family N-acetyltransferase n=1 Tax=Marinomonas foliarum TaxID=491950 RepID=UPI002161206D|nr:GNAT family N-acetyltransferase [Marinomonas foliarum]